MLPEVDVNFQIVAPIVTLAVAALIALILDLILPAAHVRRPIVWVSALGTLLSGWYLYDLWRLLPPLALVPAWNVTAGDITTAWSAFLGSIAADRLGLVFSAIILTVLLATIAMSVRRTEKDISGYYALILLGAAGMMLLVQATSFISIFLGLELLSLALYVVVGFRRADPKGKEGALKYLILGAVASGVLLYGFALLYGATGHVWLSELQAYWYAHGDAGMSTLYKAGMGLVLVGFAFKLALVPFHMWAPDAYEGAPASISGFMAVGTKAAAIGALLRLLAVGIPADAVNTLVMPLTIVGALSMFVGSMLATRQTNMKRLLAYSGMSHAGYLMMALPGLNAAGVAAAAFYMIAYGLMTLGSFAIVTWLGDSPEGGGCWEQYEGLFYERPLLAGAFTLFLLSLAGIPMTAGFIGKVYLLRQALEFGAVTLVVSLVLTSAISAYAYLRVVLAMSRRPAGVATEAGLGLTEVAATRADNVGGGDGMLPGQVAGAGGPGEAEDPDAHPLALSWPLTIVIGAAALGTVWLGLFPSNVAGLLQQLLPMM